MSGRSPSPMARDPWLDVIRAGALVLVAVGHWMLPVVTEERGAGVHAGNLLASGGLALALATWAFQVVPLIFAVGANANEGSWTRHRDAGGTWSSWVGERTTRLAGPVGVLLAFALLLGPTARLAGLDPHLAGQAVRFMTLPTWFLAAYLLQIAITPALTDARRRSAPATIAALTVGVAALDALRALDVAPVVAPLSWLLVFGLVSVVGIELARLDRRRLLVLGGVALGVLAALVAVGFYAPELVGGPGTARSNNAPPTGALALIGVAHTALALGLRPRAMRPRAAAPRDARPAGRATPGWFGWIAERQMTVFLWHLPVGFLLVGACLAVGVLPSGGWWWATRPLWLVACALATVVVVRPVAALERRLDGRLGRAAGARTPIAWAAATLSCATLAAHGVGPVPVAGWLVFAAASTVPLGALARISRHFSVLARGNFARPLDVVS